MVFFCGVGWVRIVVGDISHHRTTPLYDSEDTAQIIDVLKIR